MKPLVRIGHLIDQHPSLYKQYKNTDEEVTYRECSGCPACDQIDQLSIANGLKSKRKNAKGPTPKKKGPAPKEKELTPKKEQEPVKVDKEKEMELITQEEMKALLDKGMTVSEISKEKNIGMTTLYKKLNKWFPEYRKRTSASRFPMTQEEVLNLWNNGESKRSIARTAGVDFNKLRYWLSKWEGEGFILPERPKKTKEAAVKQYESLMTDLKNKLSLANKENDGLKALKEDLESKIEEYEEVVKLKDEKNLQLVKQIQEAVARIKELKTENRAAKEKIQTEEDYLIQIADKNDLIDRYQRDLDIYEKANKDLQHHLVDKEEIARLATELLKKVL